MKCKIKVHSISEVKKYDGNDLINNWSFIFSIMKGTIYNQTQGPLVTNVFLHWFMGHLIHIHELNLSLQPIDNLVSNWALRCNIHKNIKVQWAIKVENEGMKMQVLAQFT
jgi:hypothetical protein